MPTRLDDSLGRLLPSGSRDFLRRCGGTAAGLGLALSGAAASAQVLPGEVALQMQYAVQSFPAGTAVADLVSADINRDGDLDVLSVDGAMNGILVLHNEGASGFLPRTIVTGVAPLVLAAGDLDSDGAAELVAGYAGGMFWMSNDGLGKYALAGTFEFPVGDSGPVALRLADVDEDGRLDAVIGLSSHTVGGTTTGGLWVALGDGAGGFEPLATQDLGLRAADITLADFDGDGHLDVAQLSGQPFISSTVTVAHGFGDGTFAPGGPGFPAGIYAHGLAAGDFDGDGDVDLATGFKYWLSIRLNDGKGEFTLAQSVGVGSYVKGISIGDIDRDGDLDIAATSGGAQAIRLVVNDGKGLFTPFAAVPVSNQCFAVMLADTDNDGYLDAWAGDSQTGQLFAGTSECIVARYGRGKLNSLGSEPTMSAQGVPSITGEGFIPEGTQLLPLQPAFFAIGSGAIELPALGGLLLVQTPWVLIPAITSVGSGDPNVSDGKVSLPLGADQLAGAGIGARFFLQVLSLDPQQVDGTLASLSDGLWFEIVQ